MSETNNKIWMDGKIVPWENANVHVLTHTLHYGLGVFEGIRCYSTINGTAIFRLHEHIDRLFNSALIVNIKIPYSKEEIVRAVIDTIRINKFTECYIRPIVYLGNKKLGINFLGNDVHMSIAVWVWGQYLGDDAVTNGIKAKISSFTRPHTSTAKAKICGKYVQSVLAKIDAVTDGYDEAILLDSNGNVLEGSGENIFIISNEGIKTPPPTSILEGITRDSIIKIANNEDIKVKEAMFSRDDLYTANEAFFTGTAAEITPIREVDNRPIGKGKAGIITKRLQDIFFSIVKGREERYNYWLTYVK